MALTKEERETHILIPESEPKVTISTSIRTHITQLQKRGYTLVSVDHEVHTFEGPKGSISFRTVSQREPKKLSAEQLEKMRKGREKNNGISQR